MIEFLKKIWGYIASFGIALFAVLFGIERVRRKSAEKARDEAETKAEIAVTEKKATEKVAESIADISEAATFLSILLEHLFDDGGGCRVFHIPVALFPAYLVWLSDKPKRGGAAAQHPHL